MMSAKDWANYETRATETEELLSQQESCPDGVIHCSIFGTFEPEMHWRCGIRPKLSVTIMVLFGSCPGLPESNKYKCIPTNSVKSKLCTIRSDYQKTKKSHSHILCCNVFHIKVVDLLMRKFRLAPVICITVYTLSLSSCVCVCVCLSSVICGVSY